MFAVHNYRNHKFRTFEYEKDAMDFADELVKENVSFDESDIEIIAYGDPEIYDMDRFRDYWIE